MSMRRGMTALLAMMLAAAISSVPGSPSASADGAPPDSAMTISGQGDFTNLKVSLSQTRNLVNQSVTITWAGGAPTRPAGEFGVNYLQIMQCWGDDPSGPDRTQCQYGGSNTQTSPNTGTWVRSRQGQLRDPDRPEGNPQTGRGERPKHLRPVLAGRQRQANRSGHL